MFADGCYDRAVRKEPLSIKGPMMKMLLPLLAVLLVLTGCAHGYVLTLDSGNQIRAASKPHLNKGFYYFKDTSGQQRAVFSGRVREVAPASMVTDDKKQFRSSP